jgi:ureidoglycolate hydrolase
MYAPTNGAGVPGTERIWHPGVVAEISMATLDAEALTAQAWAPFGWLPVADTDPSDGRETLHYEWGDPHLNVIAHAADEVEHTADGLVCAGLYRHVTHTQALMPINCVAVLAVAPAGHDFASASGIAAVRAFRVAPFDVFVLARGTWHWGPFPLGPDAVRLLNVQGRRWAEDNEYADLAELTGTVLDVRSA